MIYYLPLEYLDKRYTKDLDRLILNELKKQGKKYTKIDGAILEGNIKVGAFLDSNSTNYFKFEQLQRVCELFATDKIKDGDTFFISDLWFPGLEAIPYMAYFNKKKVNITGLLHAGSWTETDYVANMKEWASYIEKGWFKFIDKIFVGSDWIKQEMLDKGRVTNFGNVINTGLPFDNNDCYEKAEFKNWIHKKNTVVFAGRLDDEKQPWLFDQLARKYPNTKFVKTMEQNLTKTSYYKLLSESKIMFSAALQENFGYATLEGASYGCNLILPNRLVYPEKYPKKFLYDTFEEAVKMVSVFLDEDNSAELVKIADDQVNNVGRIVSHL